MEIRSFGLTEVRFIDRADTVAATDTGTQDEGQGDRLRGYASVFNSASEDLGGFTEIVAPGAFKRSLDEAAAGDLVLHALWSHDWSLPLGSTRTGKLVLAEDGDGLAFDLDTSRFTPAQLDAAKDGDLRMSFGFRVRKDAWEERDDGSIVRTLHDVDLFEISPVVMPAYPDTSAALRSLEAWKAERAPVDAAPILNQAADVPPAFRGDLLAKLKSLKLRRL